MLQRQVSVGDSHNQSSISLAMQSAERDSKSLPGFLRGGLPIGGGGGTAVPSLSRQAGLCLHPFIACAMGRMRGVLSAACAADPSAGSAGCPVQPVYESLQGRASWPRSTPRRCQSAVASGLRVHRMSPVFTLPFRAKATIAFLRVNRTPVRKSYALGSTYVAVSLFSRLTLPEQQGRCLASCGVS